MTLRSNRPVWRVSLMSCAVASLAACGGGGSDGGNEAKADQQSVLGVLVQPQSTTASTAGVLARRGARESAASAACPSVPDGYDPLASVAVQFLDSANAVVTTLTTDACGGFSGDVPASVATVSAAPTGLTTISQPVSAFTGATPNVASSMSDSASLVISVLQDLGSGKVALTVSDSLTGKSVLGLAPANFGFATATAPTVSPTGVGYGASTAQSASVGIVLDASGSMSASVGSTGLSRNQLASAATHELLNGLQTGADDAGVVIFDNVVMTINDTSLATLSWIDASNNPTTPYAFSASGMTSTISKLRPIADLYNWDSAIYRFGSDPVHPDTGTLKLRASPFGGSTAYFDATSAGISLVQAGTNTRKIVVAMTDGQNNASRKTLDTVVAEAQAAGVPLYTVAFGSQAQVGETEMQSMAASTGGEYKRVEGADLTGLFQSIQTGIRFQYVADFASAFASGTLLSTTVTTGGKTVTRDLTVR